MKRIVSLLLAVAMSVSAVPTAFAADTQDHSLGTQVVFTAENNENYTITVPASLNPGQSGTVTLDGYWPDSKTVTVTAEKTVTLKNSIKAADTKTLNVTFLGISEAGSNTSKQTFTEPVSVEGISNALFGTWSGKFNYNVDSVEEEVVPPAENYIGTVSTDNTITLSGVESAGTYTLRYANANGALENYADICSLEVTDPATAVSYDDLIAENCAPVEATSIAVYNASNEKVGDIALGGLKTNLGTKLYSFGALADIHVGYGAGWYEKVNNAFKDLTQTENVDFICIPGDLTEIPLESSYQSLKTVIDGYSVPVYVSTGNHDISEYATGYNVTDELIETYTGHPRYYSFTYGNDVFIMFGVQADRAEGLFSRAQLEWLYETLEANKDKRCFVFQHVFPEDGSGNAGGFYDHDIWGYYYQESFESLMERYSNAIFFHGHSHTTFFGQTIDDMANYDNIRGVHSVHIPSVSKTRALTGEYDMSMSEGYAIDVYENGIVLRGKDFINKQYLPIAQYYLDTTTKAIGSNEIIVPVSIDWEVGMKLDSNTGVATYVEPTETKIYAASQMIPVGDWELQVGWTFGNNTTAPQVLCYDANSQYIGNVYPGADRSVTLLNNTAYIRFRGSFEKTAITTVEQILSCAWITKTFTVS